MKSITALLLLLLTSGMTSSVSAERPNVLFIAVDDLRPDLGCYGNPVVKTPNLDRLAARGTVFDHAYCQQAVCSPSRSSIMTGRRPDATRVYDLVTHFRTANPDLVTLPQHFKNHGYYCAAMGKIYHPGYEDGRSWNAPHWYPSGQTVDTDPVDWNKRIATKASSGVQEYSAAAQAEQESNRKRGGGPKAKGPAFEISPKNDEELPDGATAVEAVKRLAMLKKGKQPFFLAVGFIKPHLPFVAPKKYWDLYDPAKIPGPATDHLPEGAPPFAGHDNGELHSYTNIPKGNPIGQDLAQQLRHGYYAAISFMDAQVGRVLDALEKEGLADNTVIVLWGDHGWQLGDHGLWHKHTNFELATRAPLLVSMPRQATAGKHCPAPVEFVDVYPTLADVCGLPAPAGVHGISLKPLLMDPTASVKEIAISQYPRGGEATGGKSLMGYSIRDTRWRLTLWKNRSDNSTVATELYDEQNDPAETVNVATQNADVVTRLTALFDKTPAAKPQIEPAAKSPAKPQPKGKSKQDRGAMFDQRDKNKDGQLSREEFLRNQPDPEEAPKRFPVFDANKDGVLSREEFITGGKKKAL